MIFPRSTKYTRPGAYLGQVFKPQTAVAANVTFRPCYVGKGNRLALSKNVSIRRSMITDEALTFTTAPPHKAFLDYEAKYDKTVARLFMQDGRAVAESKWNFVESIVGQGYDQILINTADFDKNATYYIDYQSLSRDVLDDLPFSELRQLINVGLYKDQNLYIEGTDFVIPGAVIDASPSSVTNEDPITSTTITATKDGASTGGVTFGASNAYDNNYTRFYRLTVTNIGAGPPKEVTFKLEIFNHSGGNSASPQVPLTSACPNITFTVKAGDTGTYLDTNRLLQDGIYLSYTFGASNFVMGDKFEWWGYGPALIEAHSAFNTSNSQYSKISTPTLTAGGTSTATLAAGTQNNYNNEFVRGYRLQVLSIGGTAATGTITLTLAGISDNEYVLVNNGIEVSMFEFKRSGGYVATTLAVAQATISSSITKVVTVDISASGDDDAAALVLSNSVNLDTNWAAGAAEVTATPTGGGSGAVGLLSDHLGVGGNNAMVTSDAVNIAIVGMSGATALSATLAWAGWDELPYTTGSITVNESTASSYTNVTIEKGIKLTVTWPAFNVDTPFVVGNTWSFTARPPIMYYGAKDDRSYDLEITSALTKILAGTAAASTIEGGFNTWTATAADDGSGGKIDLNENVVWMARNIGNGFSASYGGAAPNRHTVGDTQVSSATCNDTIKWDINQRITETIASTAIRHDVLGVITGVPNSYYIVLDHTPVTVLYVRNASTSADLSYSTVANSAYIYFTTNPGVNIEVYYEWIGQEPDPEQVYYITGTRLRQTAEYDQPVLWRSADTARDGLAPSTTTNDLLIESEIAGELGLSEWYTCQVRDRDQDGVYTTLDYKYAIAATENVADITDLCVLNKFDALGAALNSIKQCNDMYNFPTKYRFGWFGMPVNTPLGNASTSGSTIYTAKNTLQVYGNDPSHGAHILIGNTWATRTILLDDLTEATVTLDGSFIAGAAMALQDSFSDVADDLLGKNLSGIFDTMEEFSDADELALGTNSITYLHKVGDGIFQFYEDVSVDTSALDYAQISGGKQKQRMTIIITTKLDERIRGYVPPDPLSGIVAIKSAIVSILANEASNGGIAPYGSEQNPPVIRVVNPDTDVKVFIDENIKTDYYFMFWFNLRYVMKRASGLFGVDSDAIMRGLSKI